MRKEGYAETTIERYVRLLKELSKYGDLRDSESVKVALTRTGWAEGTKEMACGAYAIYAKQHGFTFAPPRYRRVEKLPFIPLDSEVEQLIGAMGLRYSTFLSLQSQRLTERARPETAILGQFRQGQAHGTKLLGPAWRVRQKSGRPNTGTLTSYPSLVTTRTLVPVEKKLVRTAYYQ